MGNDEKTLLAVAFVALVALVIAKYRSSERYFEQSGSRPINNRNFNVINWSAVGALSSVIPQITSGENGISTNAYREPWAADCGCF